MNFFKVPVSMPKPINPTNTEHYSKNLAQQGHGDIEKIIHRLNISSPAPDAFVSSTNKALSQAYKFSKQNSSKKAYFGAFEIPFNCWYVETIDKVHLPTKSITRRPSEYRFRPGLSVNV